MKEKVILIKGKKHCMPNSKFKFSSNKYTQLPCHQLGKTESLLITYKGGTIGSYHVEFTKGSIELWVFMLCTNVHVRINLLSIISEYLVGQFLVNLTIE